MNPSFRTYICVFSSLNCFSFRISNSTTIGSISISRSESISESNITIADPTPDITITSVVGAEDVEGEDAASGGLEESHHEIMDYQSDTNEEEQLDNEDNERDPLAEDNSETDDANTDTELHCNDKVKESFNEINENDSDNDGMIIDEEKDETSAQESTEKVFETPTKIKELPDEINDISADKIEEEENTDHDDQILNDEIDN